MRRVLNKIHGTTVSYTIDSYDIKRVLGTNPPDVTFKKHKSHTFTITLRFQLYAAKLSKQNRSFCTGYTMVDVRYNVRTEARTKSKRWWMILMNVTLQTTIEEEVQTGVLEIIHFRQEYHPSKPLTIIEITSRIPPKLFQVQSPNEVPRTDHVPNSN